MSFTGFLCLEILKEKNRYLIYNESDSGDYQRRSRLKNGGKWDGKSRFGCWWQWQ